MCQTYIPKLHEKGYHTQVLDGDIIRKGINSPYETPPKPDIQINTDELTVSATIEHIMEAIEPLIKL